LPVHDQRSGLTLPQPGAAWIGRQIAALQALSQGQLRALWAETHGRPAPPGLGHDLLLRVLAHRLQEDALGGLAPEVQQRLRQLAARLQRHPERDLLATPRLKPGTRLIRHWHGELHLVEVLTQGFTYRDQRYRSLSAIARIITGTHRSGPAFFGLEPRSGPRRA
jgi:hypothetical protein